MAALQCLKLPSANLILQVAVVEVSSYQMDIPPKHVRPSVAVVLNLTPDHLERHKTMCNYAAAKCRLLSRMTQNKLGIISSGSSSAIVPADQTWLTIILLYLGNEILNEAFMEHMDELILLG